MIVLAICAVVLGAVGVSQLPHQPAALDNLGSTVSCSLDTAWECHRLAVPAHPSAGGDAQDTVDLLYAVHPAAHPLAGDRRVLVLVDGGPGASGIDDADWMTGMFGSRLTDVVDVVAFDARGIGGSDPHDCPNAQNVYADAPTTAASARTFAESCVREAGVSPDDLATYSSAQTADDIDAIRARLGVDRILIYGVSYGTVIGQAYAAAHADHLDGLILDAPVDRSLSAADFWVSATKGFDTVMSQTLDACSADDACRVALPRPDDALHRLDEQLQFNGVLSADLPDKQGSEERWEVTRADVQELIGSSMYEPATRMRFLRALAALEAGDRAPLVRLVSVMGGAGRSGFAYYATWCADDRVSPSARTDDFDGLSAYLRHAGVSDDDLDQALVLAPCLYWPYQPPSAGPPPEATTVPTLILTATADPITPPALAHAIAARHPEDRLVETRGGAHGSIGNICPDDRMRDFILDGKLPVGATSVCAGSVILPYIPDAPAHASDGRDAGLGLYWELVAEPEIYVWDGTSGLDFGCGDAGWVHLDPMDNDGHAPVTLHGCSWAADTPFGGSGWLAPNTGEADLQLTNGAGTLHVETDNLGVHVTGSWHGTPVDVRW